MKLSKKKCCYILKILDNKYQNKLELTAQTTELSDKV